MSMGSFKNSVEDNLNPKELFKAFVHSGLENPWNGLQQIAKAAHVPMPECHIVGEINNNSLAEPSNMAPDGTIASPEESTFRLQAHGPHNKVEGFMIGGHLGEAAGRPLVANWYTAVDPELQGHGIGERMIRHAYSEIFARQPDAIVVAEIEHTGVDMTKLSQAPSTTEMKAAVRAGDPASWPKDESVSFTEQLRAETGDRFTDREQTRARYGFWTRGRSFVHESQTPSGATIAAPEVKPLVIKRTWEMLDPKHPESPGTPAHLLVWTKDGRPISRAEAYEVMHRLYNSDCGYAVGEENPAVQRLHQDYQQHPEVFDAIPVSEDSNVPTTRL